MLDQQDPWLDIGEPVDAHEQNHVPRIPAQSPNTEVAAQAAPQAAPEDAFAQIGTPVSGEAPIDNSGTREMGGLPDELPDQPKSKMSPEDEAAVIHMVRTHADPAMIRQFMAAKGFEFANLDQVQAARDRPGSGVNDQPVYQFPDVKPVDNGAGLNPNAVSPETDRAAGALGRGLIDFVPGVDKLTALGHTIDNKVLGRTDKSFGDEYAYQSDIRHGVIQGDEDNHPWLRVSGQLLGGLAIPTGLEGVAMKSGTDVLAAGGSIADARAAAKLTAETVRARMVKAGGIYGALHGAGDADSPGQAVTGALTEGGLGTLGGAALGQLGVSRAGRSLVDEISPQQEAAQAAARQGLDLLPADTGGPLTRTATAFTAQTPLGVVPIANAAARLDSQAAARVEGIAGGLGDAAKDIEGIGTAASEGGVKYASAAKRAGGRLYDAAAVKAGDAQIDLVGARGVLDQQIARLQAVPGGGAGLKEAQALRADLDKPYPVQGVRDMRTENFVAPDFRGTPVEARMKAVTNAAADDIVNGLRAQGKSDAADMFKAADDHWREMLANLKRNVEPLIGPLDKLKSAEAVSTALNSAMKNNGARVGAFIGSLPAEQQGVVRASMLNPMGRDAAGNFSISRFASDWAKVSPIAKRGVFGPEARAALDDLAKVGEQAKAAEKYANHSNTARAVIGERMVGSIATGATLALSLKTLGATLAGQYGMGRLLASPRFARWLARAPKTSLSTPAYVDRLTRIARADPAIANEVLQLQQRLTSAFSGGSASVPARLAADEPQNEPLGEPGGGQGNAAQQQPQNDSLQP